ncbi:MAG: hypothetical protein JWM46_311 [Candidatus Kaiserbacteria bacterium]|nr:hypothetical protein [Candidatus Kaiserbacteria bacterium]
MGHIEAWLRQALLRLNGKLVTVDEILALSDQLAALQAEWGFEMLTDIWISFKAEEADVRIKIRNQEHTVGVCLVPIPWQFVNFRT